MIEHIAKSLVDWGIWEILILVAVVGEWYTSIKHYRHFVGRKKSANDKRKITRLIKKTLKN